MERPQAWIILMLLACVKPGFEYDCIGAVSETTAYSSWLATQRPVLSDVSCLVFVEKSSLFPRPSPPASFSASVIM